MKSLKVALSYVKNKRHDIYAEIIKAYKDAAKDESFEELIKFVDGLYRTHLKATINIETMNLTGKELQRQINIRENNLEFMNGALSEKFANEDVSKIMSLYKKLTKRETELHKLSELSSASFLAKRKVVKQVYKEMKEENSL